MVILIYWVGLVGESKSPSGDDRRSVPLKHCLPEVTPNEGALDKQAPHVGGHAVQRDSATCHFVALEVIAYLA